MKKISVLLVAIFTILLTTACDEQGLTYKKSGTFDYEGKDPIATDVYVKADGVTLKNMTINADLYIDESVKDGHIELHNVSVKGTIFVAGGGLETIYIEGGRINEITVEKESVRIEIVGDAEVLGIVVKESGVVIENSETTLDTYPDITISLVEPAEEDEPVVLDGKFDTVTVKPGSNVEVKEESQIKWFPFTTCSREECPEHYRSRVKINKDAKIEKMDIDNPTDINNEGEITEQNYGENMTEAGEEITNPEDDNYKPQIINRVTCNVQSNGDYTITFKTNNEGTIYYMIQPWFDSTNITLTAEDIINKKPYKFEMQLSPGENVEDFVFMVSAKNIKVTSANTEVKGTGYMGDSFGSRPPADDNIAFDSVIWYVFKDKDGMYSEVGKLIVK